MRIRKKTKLRDKGSKNRAAKKQPKTYSNQYCFASLFGMFMLAIGLFYLIKEHANDDKSYQPQKPADQDFQAFADVASNISPDQLARIGFILLGVGNAYTQLPWTINERPTSVIGDACPTFSLFETVLDEKKTLVVSCSDPAIDSQPKQLVVNDNHYLIFQNDLIDILLPGETLSHPTYVSVFTHDENSPCHVAAISKTPKNNGCAGAICDDAGLVDISCILPPHLKNNSHQTEDALLINFKQA